MLLYVNGSHVVDRSVALAAQIHTYIAAHAASCLPLTTAQATALGRDSRRRVPSEQCGLEHMRRPAPRLDNPDCSQASCMPAQPVPSKFLIGSRWMGRSSCCPPKIWPMLSAGSHRALRSSGVQLLLVGLVALVGQAVVVLADGRPHHTTSSGSTALSALRMPSSRALMLQHVSRARSGPRLGDHG